MGHWISRHDAGAGGTSAARSGTCADPPRDSVFLRFRSREDSWSQRRAIMAVLGRQSSVRMPAHVFPELTLRATLGEKREREADPQPAFQTNCQREDLFLA